MTESPPILSTRAQREIRLADLGELAGPLVHEFNNLLNTWTLHLALLEQQTPGAAADLQGLRQQMRRMTAQVGRFQCYRQGDPPVEGADLGWAVSRALQCLARAAQDGPDGLPLEIQPADEAGPNAVRVSLDLADDLPPVRSHEADLERLCRFLLRNAARAARVARSSRMGNMEVTVRVFADKGEVVLTVEDSGPDVATALLPHVFEPDPKSREGVCGLELAACRSIIRRLNGRISARGRPGGGLTVEAVLPADEGAAS